MMLAWRHDAHGWIARCGEDGQGEVRVLPFRGGWIWFVDMLPGTDEDLIIAQDVCAGLEDARIEAERQVQAWPEPIEGARRR